MIHSQSDCRHFCWATAFIFHDGVFQRCRPTFQPHFFQRHLFQPQGGSRYIVNVFNLCMIHAHNSADPCFCSSRGGAQATKPCSSHLFPLLGSSCFCCFSAPCVFLGFQPWRSALSGTVGLAFDGLQLSFTAMFRTGECNVLETWVQFGASLWAGYRLFLLGPPAYFQLQQFGAPNSAVHAGFSP